MTGIEMPMQLKDKPRFDRQNNISISVYGWEPAKENKEGEQEVGFAYVLRVAEQVKLQHVNLLMIGDEVKTLLLDQAFFKVGQCTVFST